jgi:hypothetical protein
MVVLLLLLELQAVAPSLWRSVQLSHGGHVNHAVLQWSTARTSPVGPGMVLFLFFSSAASQAFMVPS